MHTGLIALGTLGIEPGTFSARETCPLATTLSRPVIYLCEFLRLFLCALPSVFTGLNVTSRTARGPLSMCVVNGPRTPGEGDPAGIARGLPVPVGHHQQAAGDREGDDAHDDEEQRGHPLGGKPRRDAGPLPSVDGLALTHQAHREGAWGRGGRGRRERERVTVRIKW